MLEDFLGKKMYVINCDVCDARKVKEEDLSSYEKIIINTDAILVNEHAKSVLSRLPIICNAGHTLELEGDVNVISHNGDYEINGSTAVPENTFLSVNGNVIIKPGTGEVLSSYTAVSINGSVLCPASLAPFLSRFSVNGSTECYPDDCTVLDAVFTPDTWFPLRARQEAHYYVSEQLRLTEPKLDIAALAAKQVRFVTPAALVPEERVEEAVALFDETVKLTVIPAGYAFIPGDARLDESLLEKYGGKFYMDGSLTIESKNASLLSRLEKPQITGTVSLPESLMEAFRQTGAEYGKLQIVKGTPMAGKAMLTLDNALLDTSPDGVSIHNCGLLRIKKDVSPERILDLVQTCNCGCILCTPEQKGAVELVSRNAGFIGDLKEKSGSEGGGGMLAMLKQAANTKVANADLYVL